MTKAEWIESALAAGDKGIKEFEMPDGVDGLGSINDSFGMFQGSSNLKSVTIGTDVKVIGRLALCGCESLETINYGGTKAQWNAIKKGDNWNYMTGSFIILCADGSKLDKWGHKVD